MVKRGAPKLYDAGEFPVALTTRQREYLDAESRSQGIPAAQVVRNLINAELPRTAENPQR